MTLGYIYKLTPYECCEYYIGSSFNMKKRVNTHNVDIKNKTKTRKLYEKIRECDGFNIEVLYEYECENETELRMEEQRCMDKLKPTLNSQRAFNSDEYSKDKAKEYYQENRDVIIEKQKVYAEKNSEARKEYSREYNQKNKDVLRDKATEYRQKNADKIKEKTHQQYIKNADKIKEKKRQQYIDNPDKKRQYYRDNIERITKQRKALKELRMKNNS